MTTGIPCELVTWDTVYELARRLAHRIRGSGFAPDMIVAIGRGGYIPGRILSDYLNIMDLSSFKIEHYRGTQKSPVTVVKYPLSANVDGRRILLVDDVSDTGDTFDVAIKHIEERGRPEEIKTVVLDYKTVSRLVPDYYAREITEWRWIIYPWAVIEDLTSIARAMTPRPQSIEALAERLQQAHGIRVPPDTLANVLSLLECEGPDQG